MEQSEISIDKTLNLFEDYGMFKDLTSQQVNEVLKSLNKIAISGYNDARKSFNV